MRSNLSHKNLSNSLNSDHVNVFECILWARHKAYSAPVAPSAVKQSGPQPYPVEQALDRMNPSQVHVDVLDFSKSSDFTDEQVEADPFGLLPKAEAWLRNELGHYDQQNGQSSGCCGTLAGSHGSYKYKYSPFECEGRDAHIPDEHFTKAFVEFSRRFPETTNHDDNEINDDKTPTVLLVATKVAKNWTPSEAVGKGRFLLFPEITIGGEDMSALFLTYMPGSVHGSADKFVSDELGQGIRANPLLFLTMNYGASSGSNSYYQPDIRVFPSRKYRDLDRQGRDTDKDKANENNPFSRFIWEIEYKNRDPVKLRQRGKKYAATPYTRAFLGAKIFGVTAKGQLEAAVVLWGKTGEARNAAVTVLDAVDFGTVELTEEHKEEFSERDHDKLVGVTENQWRRPQPAPDLSILDTTPQDWKINIPYAALLYKVTRKENCQHSYILNQDTSANTTGGISIDLRRLSIKILELYMFYETDDGDESE